MAQVGAGHVGEQVVLDLVVEPPEEEIDQAAAADVAGGQDLAAEEVELVGLGEGGHALVVGGERAAQVQAEQALLDQGEGDRLERRQDQQQGRHIQHGMGHQEQAFDQVGPAAALEDRGDAGHMEVAGLQQQQGEEQERLGAGDHPGQAPLATGLGGGEGQGGDADVGVQVLVVGVGVMGVVLGDPPAKADPDQQVGVDQADQVVGPAAAEDLAVAGVVADKAELGRHHRQIDRREQLPPGLAQDQERDPAGGQQDQVEGDLGHVPAVAALQQPGLFDLPRQLGVLTPASRGRLRRSGGQRLVEASHAGLLRSSGRRPGSGSLASNGRSDRIGLINSCTATWRLSHRCR